MLWQPININHLRLDSLGILSMESPTPASRERSFLEKLSENVVSITRWAEANRVNCILVGFALDLIMVNKQKQMHIEYVGYADTDRVCLHVWRRLWMWVEMDDDDDDTTCFTTTDELCPQITSCCFPMMLSTNILPNGGLKDCGLNFQRPNQTVCLRKTLSKLKWKTKQKINAWWSLDVASMFTPLLIVKCSHITVKTGAEVISQ